ncbi:MAG TPA: hypothetical protein VK763_03380 [Terriglobales bacterium]|jgi:hypothetical protein|nr:hypothetical protein [Terriglobales bacterium]
MEKAKQLRKRNVPLEDALEKRLLGYVLAATASGVTVLALVEPSQAEVVYTPTNQSIWANGGVLDLNNDGVVDFEFRAQVYSSHTSCAIANFYGLYIVPAVKSNAVRGYASALPSSILVGQNAEKFKQGGGRGFIAGWNDIRWGFCRSTSHPPDYEILGPFANTDDRYLGLQFSINGEIHYGWARFNVTDTGKSVSAILTGYAYETTPGAPIFTGQAFGDESKENPGTQTGEHRVTPSPGSASLGRLAQGAEGLASWRLRRVGKLPSR